MSLQTICANVALDLGVAVPAGPVFGSTVPAAQRLFAQARRAAEALHRRAPWSALVVEHEFTASGSSSGSAPGDFALPEDFAWMVSDTLWERSRYWALRGAMSPQKWQLYKSSIFGRATIWRRWRVRLPSGAAAGAATQFSIDPPIAAGDTTSKFVFEYVSKNWCVSQPPGGPTAMADHWTGDNDQSVLDEWLIELGTRWRVLRRLGLAYDEDKDEAEREEDKAIARDAGTAILDLVPAARRDDFIGQYTLGAFPPVPAPPLAQMAAAATIVGPPASRLLLAPPPAAPLPLTRRPDLLPQRRPPNGADGGADRDGAFLAPRRRPSAPMGPSVPAGVLAPLEPRRPRLYQPPMSDE